MNVIPKILIAIVLCALNALAAPAAGVAEKPSIKLITGDTLTGSIGGVKDGAVSIVTDYGVVRVPIEKLSPESKAKLNITEDAHVPALKSRIAELEALVERLRSENAGLRKAGQAEPTAPSPAVRPSTGSSKDVDPTPVTGGYKLSSSGKRHNSRCRYFGSAGRACGSSEGVACKICGG